MVSSSVTVASFPGAIDAVYHRSRWPCGNLRARHAGLSTSLVEPDGLPPSLLSHVSLMGVNHAHQDNERNV